MIEAMDDFVPDWGMSARIVWIDMVLSHLLLLSASNLLAELHRQNGCKDSVGGLAVKTNRVQSAGCSSKDRLSVVGKS